MKESVYYIPETNQLKVIRATIKPEPYDIVQIEIGYLCFFKELVYIGEL